MNIPSQQGRHWAVTVIAVVTVFVVVFGFVVLVAVAIGTTDGARTFSADKLDKDT